MIKNKFLATLFLTSAISATASYAATADYDFSALEHSKLPSMTQVEFNAMIATVEKKSLQIEAWRPTMDAFNEADFDIADLTEQNKLLLNAAAASGFVATDLTADNKNLLNAAAASGFVATDLTADNKNLLSAATNAGFVATDLTAGNKEILDAASSLGFDITTISSEKKAEIANFLNGIIPSLTEPQSKQYLPGTSIEVSNTGKYTIEGTEYDAGNLKTAYGFTYDQNSGDYFNLSAKTKTAGGKVEFAEGKWELDTTSGELKNKDTGTTYAANTDNGNGSFTVTDADGRKLSFNISNGEPFTENQIEATALYTHLSSFGGKIKTFADKAFDDAASDYSAALQRLNAVALKFGK